MENKGNMDCYLCHVDKEADDRLEDGEYAARLINSIRPGTDLSDLLVVLTISVEIDLENGESNNNPRHTNSELRELMPQQRARISGEIDLGNRGSYNNLAPLPSKLRESVSQPSARISGEIDPGNGEIYSNLAPIPSKLRESVAKQPARISGEIDLENRGRYNHLAPLPSKLRESVTQQPARISVDIDLGNRERYNNLAPLPSVSGDSVPQQPTKISDEMHLGNRESYNNLAPLPSEISESMPEQSTFTNTNDSNTPELKSRNCRPKTPNATEPQSKRASPSSKALRMSQGGPSTSYQNMASSSHTFEQELNYHHDLPRKVFIDDNYKRIPQIPEKLENFEPSKAQTYQNQIQQDQMNGSYLKSSVSQSAQNYPSQQIRVNGIQLPNSPTHRSQSYSQSSVSQSQNTVNAVQLINSEIHRQQFHVRHYNFKAKIPKPSVNPQIQPNNNSAISPNPGTLAICNTTKQALENFLKRRNSGISTALHCQNRDSQYPSIITSLRASAPNPQNQSEQHSINATVNGTSPFASPQNEHRINVTGPGASHYSLPQNECENTLNATVPANSPQNEHRLNAISPRAPPFSPQNEFGRTVNATNQEASPTSSQSQFLLPLSPSSTRISMNDSQNENRKFAINSTNLENSNVQNPLRQVRLSRRVCTQCRISVTMAIVEWNSRSSMSANDRFICRRCLST